MHISRSQKLSAVIAISFCFFVAEIAVGFRTHSLALIADAFHYLNDLLSFVVALSAIQIGKRSGKPPDGFSFGWQRAQLVGAFFNAAFLAALGLSIALQALERFVSLQKVEQPLLVLIVGAVGLALNIMSALLLGHDHGHGHKSHGNEGNHDSVSEIHVTDGGADTEGAVALSLKTKHHDHTGHRHVTDASPLQHQHRNLGMFAVLLHVIGDAINNLGVIAAASIIKWTTSPSRFYADPAVSLFIAIMVISTAIPLLHASGRILLQAGPSDIDLKAVKLDLESVQGVEGVHELHVWRLSEEKTVASAHLVVDDAEGLGAWMEKARRVGECLHAYGVHSYTLQPEPIAGVELGNGCPALAGGQVRQRSWTSGKCRLKCDAECKDLRCCDEGP